MSNLLFQILKNKFRFKRIKISVDSIVFIALLFASYLVICIITPWMVIEEHTEYTWMQVFIVANKFFFIVFGALIGLFLVGFIIKILFSAIFEVN